MGKQTTTALAKRPATSNQTYTVVDTPAVGKLQFISHAALKVGTHIVAGVGAGKSRLLALIFVWNLLLSNKSGVIFDPTGGVVDHLFSKILHLPPEEQAPFWQRIVYINAGDKDFLFPSPLYYRLSKDETLFEIANRFPSVLKRIDPELTSAPILGWNSLYECLIYAGEIAAARGEQLDFVADLIAHPGKYKNELRQVVADYPELHPAVAYFRALMDPTASGLREKKTGSSRTKLLPFLADPTRMATYAGKNNRRNWKKFIKSNKVVIVDYREVRDQDNLQFDMVWDFKGFMDAIKQRGMAGRGHEVTLIIDEVTAMLGQRTDDGRSILAEDLQELISRVGRNYGVNTVIAHQGLYQIDKRIQEVLMGMGNQLIGQLSSPADAVRVAHQLMRYNPYKIKKTDNVYQTVTPLPILSYFGGPDRPYPQVIDVRTHEFTPEEQLLQWVNQLLDLDRFQFLTQIASGEGGKKAPIQKITMANLDKGQYPQEEILAPLRQALARRDGLPVAELLQTLHQQRPDGDSQKPKQSAKKSARLNTNSSPTYVAADNHLPVQPDPATLVSAPLGEAHEPDDEAVFQ